MEELPKSRVKRSIGVSIMGWLMIILAAIQLQQSFDFAGLMQVYNTVYPKPLGIIYYSLTIPLLFAEIILGINILNLKEWARKGVLLLIVIYLLITLSMSFTVNKNYGDYIRRTYSELQSLTRKLKWEFHKKKIEYEKRLVLATEAEKRAITENYRRETWMHLLTQYLTEFYMWLNITVLMIKFFLWYVIAAIFFTRTKVKDQFSLNASP